MLNDKKPVSKPKRLKMVAYTTPFEDKFFRRIAKENDISISELMKRGAMMLAGKIDNGRI